MAKFAEIPALTGLRGAGALWVFLHHINLFSYGTGRGVHALAVGYVGVDLFFLLSGFVMCASKWDLLRRPDLRSYGLFVAERITRLYPTNVAVLLLFAAAAACYPAVWEGKPATLSSVGSFVSSLLLLQTWLPSTQGAWNQPCWTVSAEIGAYLALPLLLTCLRPIRDPRLALGLATAFLMALVLILTAANVSDLNVKVRGGVVRLICEFAAGGLLYAGWSRRLAWSQAICGLVTLAALALFAAAVTLPVTQANFLFLPAFMLILLLCANGKGSIAGVLASAPAVALGRISYSLYLVHWPVLMFWSRALGVGPQSPHWRLMGPLLVVVTLALATAIHLAIEAPSHRLARRLSRRGLFTAPSHAAVPISV